MSERSLILVVSTNTIHFCIFVFLIWYNLAKYLNFPQTGLFICQLQFHFQQAPMFHLFSSQYSCTFIDQINFETRPCDVNLNTLSERIIQWQHPHQYTVCDNLTLKFLINLSCGEGLLIYLLFANKLESLLVVPLGVRSNFPQALALLCHAILYPNLYLVHSSLCSVLRR